MAAHKFWRINGARNVNATYGQIMLHEVYLRDTPAGTDLTNGGAAGTATAKDSADATNVPGEAVDDTNYSKWLSLTVDSWWQFEFTTAVDLVEVGIYLHTSGDKYGPRNFDIEHSDDGVTWVTRKTIDTTWTATETKTWTLDADPADAAADPGTGEDVNAALFIVGAVRPVVKDCTFKQTWKNGITLASTAFAEVEVFGQENVEETLVEVYGANLDARVKVRSEGGKHAVKTSTTSGMLLWVEEEWWRYGANTGTLVNGSLAQGTDGEAFWDGPGSFGTEFQGCKAHWTKTNAAGDVGSAFRIDSENGRVLNGTVIGCDRAVHVGSLEYPYSNTRVMVKNCDFRDAPFGVASGVYVTNSSGTQEGRVSIQNSNFDRVGVPLKTEPGPYKVEIQGCRAQGFTEIAWTFNGCYGSMLNTNTVFEGVTSLTPKHVSIANGASLDLTNVHIERVGNQPGAAVHCADITAKAVTHSNVTCDVAGIAFFEGDSTNTTKTSNVVS